jgi:hypothetical protein
MGMNYTDTDTTDLKKYYKRSHAIVIGISKYKEETSLSNAYNDAAAIKRVLEDNYNFDNVITLFNEEATADKIRELLQDTLRDESTIGTKDRVLIYYSGHGKLRTDTKPNGEEIKTGYIIPYDSRLGRYWASIEMDDLIRSCQGSKAKHILLVLDCCYSGFAATRSVDSKVPPKNVDEKYLKDITQRRAIQVLAATQEDEPANDSGILPGFSSFTGALLGILKNEKDPIPNGIITASEIGTVLQQEVVHQKGVFQRPSYNVIAGSEGGDFIFKVLPKAIVQEVSPPQPPTRVPIGGPIKGGRATSEDNGRGPYEPKYDQPPEPPKQPSGFNSKILIPIIAVAAIVGVLAFASLGGLFNTKDESPGGNGLEPMQQSPDSPSQSDPKNTNNPPVANADLGVTTNMNQPVTVQVGGFDQDNDDQLTASIISPPSHGQLSKINQESGDVTYTPDNDFVGNDEFTFNVNDGKADSDNFGRVLVSVVSD